ncbi:MAG: DUF4817 domain-containing protein [Sphingobacteriaceae bacterium]|nr:MAG: DUF4817 domain-containing protein [Sphingobacteriaceae bacterium]
MVKYTLKERWDLLKIYFESNCVVSETVRKAKKIFGKNRAPSHQYVTWFVSKVESTGMLIDSPTHNKPNTVRTPETVQAVAENVRESPSTSTRHRSQELDISRTTLRRILHKDLGMTAYKIQLTRKLEARDHPLRFCFAEWANERLIAKLKKKT